MRIAGTTTEQSFVRIYLGMKHIGYTIQQSFLSPNMLCIYASVPLWSYRSFALHLRMNKHDNVVLAGNLTYLNPTSLSVWELCNSPHIHFAVPSRIGSLSKKKNTEVDQVTAMEIQVGSTASVLPSPASPLDSTSWCAHRTTHYLPGFGSQHLSGGIHPTRHGSMRRSTPSMEEHTWIGLHTCPAHSKHQWWSQNLHIVL